jgi:hypothetical protein
MQDPQITLTKSKSIFKAGLAPAFLEARPATPGGMREKNPKSE